jgi:hypothetical protein
LLPSTSTLSGGPTLSASSSASNDLIARDPATQLPLLTGPSRADISSFAAAYSEAGGTQSNGLDDSARFQGGLGGNIPGGGGGGGGNGGGTSNLLGLSEASETDRDGSGMGTGSGLDNKGLIGELYRRYHSRYDGSRSGMYTYSVLLQD